MLKEYHFEEKARFIIKWIVLLLVAFQSLQL